MKTAVAIPKEYGVTCFSDLPLQSLDHLIERYEIALRDGGAERPLGAPREMVDGWLKDAQAEWTRREQDAIEDEETGA